MARTAKAVAPGMRDWIFVRRVYAAYFKCCIVSFSSNDLHKSSCMRSGIIVSDCSVISARDLNIASAYFWGVVQFRIICRFGDE